MTTLAWYGDDIRILRELGHEVVVATRIREIPLDCDVYYAWWPGWGVFTLLVSKLRRRPHITVGAIHLTDRRFGYDGKPWWRRLLMRLDLRYTDAALAVSMLEYEGFKALGARNPILVYHAVSIPAVVAGISVRSHTILSLGQLNARTIERKRFGNVIRAIPMVRAAAATARFVIAGPKSSGWEKLSQLAEKLGVSDAVSFPGVVENAERDRLYRECAVLAQPCEYEGFGLVQAEAMAAGLPVVTSKGGAVEEVVGDAGLYCDKDSPEDIAEKVLSLLCNQMLWRQCSERGRRRVQKLFPYESRRDQIAGVIDQVCRRYRILTSQNVSCADTSGPHLDGDPP